MKLDSIFVMELEDTDMLQEVKKATEKFPVFYNKRKNTIAAISMSGVLDAVTYDHNISGETFANFLRKNMLQHFQPFNGTNPHSIVVMDNASIHHIRRK